MSNRGLTPGMLTAVGSGLVYPVLFGFLDFVGGPVRVCTHLQGVSWNGYTWAGLGLMIGVEQIKESKAVEATGVILSLNGVDSALVSEVLTQRSRGRTCQVYLGLFDTSGSILSDPVMIFAGRTDQPKIMDGGDTCTITVSAESRMQDLQRARNGRYTDQDQQARYAGDLGLSFVAGLQNKDVHWGQKDSALSSSSVSSAASKNNKVPSRIDPIDV